jgi:hypothetical protein
MSYTLKPGSIISPTPLSHHDFTQLPLTAGESIDACPDISGNGNDVTQSASANQPIMLVLPEILAPPTANKYAKFMGSHWLDVSLSSPITTEPVEMIIVGFVDQSSSGGIMTVRNSNGTASAGTTYVYAGINSSGTSFRMYKYNIYGSVTSYATPLSPILLHGRIPDHKRVTITAGSSHDTISELTKLSAGSYGDPGSIDPMPFDQLVYGKAEDGNGTPNLWTNGYIAEALLFDTALSDTDRDTIFEYLQEKHDLNRSRRVGDYCLSYDGTGYTEIDLSAEIPSTKTHQNRPPREIDMWVQPLTGDVIIDDFSHEQLIYSPDKPMTGQYLSVRYRPYLSQLIMLSRGATKTIKINPGEWQHIRFSYDIENNKTHIILNGQIVYTYASYTGARPPDLDKIYLGGVPDEMFNRDPESNHYANLSYRNFRGKIAGIRQSFEDRKGEYSDTHAWPTLQTTTPSGSYYRPRAERGRLPLNEAIGRNVSTIPKYLNKYPSSLERPFGGSISNTSSNLPDLIDYDIPSLSASLYNCQLYFNGNDLTNIDALSAFDFSNRNTSSYYCYFQDNRITDIRALSNSSMLQDGRWYHLRFDVNRLTNVDALSSVTYAQVIYLNINRRLSGIDGLVAMNNPAMTTLYARHTNIKSFPANSFAGCPNLTYVSMYNSALSSLDGLENTSITNLYVNTQYSSSLNIDALADMPSMKWLEVYHNTLDDPDNFPSLEKTNMSHFSGYSTNLTDLSFLTTPVSSEIWGETSTPTTAYWENVYASTTSLSGSHLITAGNNTSKRVNILNNLSLYNNPEVEDLRLFAPSYDQRASTTGYYAGNISYNRVMLNSTGITNTDNSIGVMKNWWRSNRLNAENNPQLTTLDKMFTNTGLLYARDHYYTNYFMRRLELDDCGIDDVDWMLADNFAGVEHVELNGNPIDFPAFQAIATQLVALKTNSDIRLNYINLVGTTWDTKHSYGGENYQNSIYGTSAEYTLCNGVSGVGTGLSPQGQLKKDLWDVGIKLNFSSPSQAYHPNYLGPSTQLRTCPNPYLTWL